MNIENLKKSKKGFTLVEIIVVLVIIAILAAIAIPAMTGWIDKANNRANYAEARTVLLAAQTIASEQYATSPGATTVVKAQVASLSAIDINRIGTIAVIANEGKIGTLSYINGTHTLTYGAVGGVYGWTSNK